jgi:hypothetical protein
MIANLIRATAYLLSLLVACAAGWFWNEYVHADLVTTLRADVQSTLAVARANATMADRALEMVRTSQRGLNSCLARNSLPVAYTPHRR